MGKKKCCACSLFLSNIYYRRHLNGSRTQCRTGVCNVIVHDPSVIKINDTYYVFGSHLAS